jgi:hypothetical protein
MIGVDLTTLKIWSVVDIYRDPFGVAGELLPGVETSGMSERDATDLRERARIELARRGLTDDELTAVFEGATTPVLRVMRGEARGF